MDGRLIAHICTKQNGGSFSELTTYRPFEFMDEIFCGTMSNDIKFQVNRINERFLHFQL